LLSWCPLGEIPSETWRTCLWAGSSNFRDPLTDILFRGGSGIRKTCDRVHLCPPGARKSALFQVRQQHLLRFEQEWTDKSDGRTLPSFVTEELHDFLG
jgi:hypothetical protein